jgi:hypothetical protein
MIREGLLDSERYWSCTIEARELYRHIQLLADDFGCVSMSQAFIGRRCFDQRPTSEKLSRLIIQLCDADLIRQYQVDGVSYAFIPRFGQRLQRFTLKHPKPPESVLQGDERAIDLFKRINNNNQTSADGQQLANRSPTNEEKLKLKRREEEVEVKTGPVDNSTKVISRAQVQIQNRLAENIQGKTYGQWLKDLSIEIKPSWTAADAKLAVDQALAAKP